MVMTLGESESMVYEALGRYIDCLYGSEYLGTARGKAVFYGERAYSLTPTKEPFPFMNVFYSDELMEIISLWGKRERKVFSVRLAPDGITSDRLTGLIEIVFHPHSGGTLIVTLYGNREFAKTLKSAARECRKDKNPEGMLVSSRVSR